MLENKPKGFMNPILGLSKANKRGMIGIFIALILVGALAVALSMFFYFAASFISLNTGKLQLSPADGNITNYDIENYLIILVSIVLIVLIVKMIYSHFHKRHKAGKRAKKGNSKKFKGKR